MNHETNSGSRPNATSPVDESRSEARNGAVARFRGRKVSSRIILALLGSGGAALLSGSIAACSSAEPAPTVALATQASAVVTPAVVATPSSTSWLVALCYPSDSDAGVPAISPGRDQTFYQNLFTKTGTGSVPDYFAAQSYGSTSVNATVTNWVSTGHSLSWHQGQSRETNIETCVNAAIAAGSYPSSFYNYVAVYNGQLDEGNTAANIQGKWVPGVIIDAMSPESGVLHEMGHGFGLNHAYNDQGGEYGDPYDIMSAMNIYPYAGQYCVSTGGWYACDNGPGMSMWTRWQLGWLKPAQRQMWWPATSGTPLRTQNAVLAARNESPGTLPQVLYVPAAATYMYTVEWIVPDNYDLGNLYSVSSPTQNPRPPTSSLVIHKINYGDQNTYLVTEPGGVQTLPVTPGNDGALAGFTDPATGVTIELTGAQGTTPQTTTANVQITVGTNSPVWANDPSTGTPPADSSLVQWEAVSPSIPGSWSGNEVVGGSDPTLGILYPCRAWYGGGVHLGKVSSSGQSCLFPWGGKELTASPAFEVLTAPSTTATAWVGATQGGALPTGALAAGFDGGNTLYVCQAVAANGRWTPGKLIWGLCDVSLNGAETFYSSYQVLTVAPSPCQSQAVACSESCGGTVSNGCGGTFTCPTLTGARCCTHLGGVWFKNHCVFDN